MGWEETQRENIEKNAHTGNNLRSLIMKMYCQKKYNYNAITVIYLLIIVTFTALYIISGFCQIQTSKDKTDSQKYDCAKFQLLTFKLESLLTITTSIQVLTRHDSSFHDQAFSE